MKIPRANDIRLVVESELMRTVQLWQDFDHPNIVKYVGYNFDNREFKLIMQRSSLSLFDLLKEKKVSNEKVDENLFKHLAKGIISGLDFLHSQDLLHCELKPGNVLLDRNLNARLTDFALVKDGELP